MIKTKPVIVLLMGMNLTTQNADRTGVNHLLTEFDIITFDCRQLLNRPIDPSIQTDHSFTRICQLKNIDEFVSNVKKYKPIYALDFIGPCREMKLIQPLLRDNGCKFVIQKLGQLPQPPLLKRTFHQILMIFAQPRRTLNQQGSKQDQSISQLPLKQLRAPKHLLFANLMKSKFQTRYVRKADLALAAGRKAVKSCGRQSRVTLNVKSTDVHYFEQTAKNYVFDSHGENPVKYALFIDDAIVYATDWALLGLVPPVESSEYFGYLNGFFDHIEKEFNLDIVIAGHPQLAENPKYAQNFDGRHVVFNNTPKLVLDSKFVIVHSSTATSFAVLSNKPIMVVTSVTLDGSSYGQGVRSIAAALGSKLTFIDRPFKTQTIPKINGKKYSAYLNNYMFDRLCKEESPWSAFLSYVIEQRRAK
jgi:hypothetical protein